MKSKKKQKLLENSQIPWHLAFIEALQLELEDYKDVLEFHSELQLTTEPLRIDCVVIKKKKGVKIKKNIGRIFRTWNLIEYKSPDDYVSISDYYKVYGYACIYTYLNNVPITDLTITIIESHYPRELIKHLKNIRGFTVAKISAGVYTVKGDILPIQIIDNRKLSAEDNVWLKNLCKKLEHTDVELLLKEIAQQGKSARIKAYTYAVMHIYIKTMKERNMTSKIIDYEQAFYEEFGPFFEEIGLVAKWQKEGESRERQKWAIMVADNEAKIASKEAEIERLRLQVAELESKLR